MKIDSMFTCNEHVSRLDKKLQALVRVVKYKSIEEGDSLL